MLRQSAGKYLKSPIVCFFLMAFMMFLLYKPLPEGFTKTKVDRFIMHVVEPALRVAYYYPSRMFSKPSSMVWWTRMALDNLSKTLGLTVNAGHLLNIEWKTWNGIKVRVYQPKYNYTSSGGGVFFIHGGGFALGNVGMYETLVSRMAAEMNTVFVSVEYRLSPETIFPGGILDCETALDYFFDNAAMEYGIDASKIVVMGDSAGGNLATVLAQRRTARQATPQLAGQVLIYPLLQMADMQTISYRYFLNRLSGYALVDPESVAYYYMFYAGINMDEKAYLVPDILTNGHVSPKLKDHVDEIYSYNVILEDEMNYRNSSIPQRAVVRQNREAQKLLEPFLTNPDFSPLMRKDLSGMPPTMVITCEFDILRDEGIVYAERLKIAGVVTHAINYENGFHAMLNFHSELFEASQSVADIEEWTLKAIKSA
ncbi:unnamed protein product [Caenorhabditis bovis]|uniref:Alpha/beta hydrolase fold-3 domain-containing protein n=1 Tax=Caenorhabditis bovis TaxID=2654633 RepID=A0A8S1EIZ7_9PELO|nr:unnamed protein product [Caenorhabditis bovis]